VKTTTERSVQEIFKNSIMEKREVSPEDQEIVIELVKLFKIVSAILASPRTGSTKKSLAGDLSAMIAVFIKKICNGIELPPGFQKSFPDLYLIEDSKMVLERVRSQTLSLLLDDHA
jgi:hypothetical protein